LVAWILSYPPLTFVLVAVTTASTLLANYQQTYYAGYLAREENHRAAALTAAVGVLTLAGAAVSVAVHGSIVTTAVTGGAGGLIAIAIAAGEWRGRVSHVVAGPSTRTFLKKATPFAAAGILYYVYFRI